MMRTNQPDGSKGQPLAIPGMGQRFFGRNMISGVTNRGEMAWMVFRERFTAGGFVQFLRRLIQHSDRKVLLIVDRHPVHRSRLARRCLAEHADSIRRFYLPGSSPQPNPDEFLNPDVKTNAVGRQRPKDRTDMPARVRSDLRSTQRQSHIVRSHFSHEDVRYAAAS